MNMKLGEANRSQKKERFSSRWIFFGIFCLMCLIALIYSSTQGGRAHGDNHTDRGVRTERGYSPDDGEQPTTGPGGPPFECPEELIINVAQNWAEYLSILIARLSGAAPYNKSFCDFLKETGVCKDEKCRYMINEIIRIFVSEEYPFLDLEITSNQWVYLPCDHCEKTDWLSESNLLLLKSGNHKPLDSLQISKKLTAIYNRIATN